ncbi:MAG TPA: hypothetical protein PKL84_01480 [Candidatus Hydrogenedentes bacterium]|nr:hypothetical protein [Candidatus Hydrogenedentota bacterium]
MYQSPLSLDGNCEAALPDLTGQVVATENCGVPVITQTPPGGTMISTDSAVTLTATDAAGLTDTCEVTVTVKVCGEGDRDNWRQTMAPLPDIHPFHPDEGPVAPTFLLDGHEHLQGISVHSPDVSAYAALLGGLN